jgi:hypothetical protein
MVKFFYNSKRHNILNVFSNSCYSCACQCWDDCINITLSPKLNDNKQELVGKNICAFSLLQTEHLIRQIGHNFIMYASTY